MITMILKFMAKTESPEYLMVVRVNLKLNKNLNLKRLCQSVKRKKNIFIIHPNTYKNVYSLHIFLFLCSISFKY